MMHKGVTPLGMDMILRTVLTNCATGWTPIQTVPNPKPAAVMRMFSVAAEQSCTQNRRAAGLVERPGLPQITMAAGALRLPKMRPSRNWANFSGSVTRINSQGLQFMAEGADMAACNNRSSFSGSTGWPVYLRMLRRRKMVLRVGFKDSPRRTRRVTKEREGIRN